MVVVTGFGLVPAVVGACIWAKAISLAEPAIATTSKVAESTVLMTNPGIAAIADYAHLLGRQQPDAGSGNNPFMLSDKELERYARHIVLREVGGPGQTALKEASVLVIGAGGLGAPALMYLAAAGVGTLGVVDDDRVSLSNLQRQIIHTTP